MDAVPVAIPAANPAVIPRQQQIINPITEVAGQILFSIGLIFSTVPIWSFFVDILIPNPFLIAIGGIAFCALGIKLLIDNIAPPPLALPQPQPHKLHNRQRSLSTGNLNKLLLQESPTASPKKHPMRKSTSARDLAKMAALPGPVQDPTELEASLEELADEKRIIQLSRETLKLAERQMQIEPEEGLFGVKIVDLPHPIESCSPKQLVHGCTVGMTSLDHPDYPETYICDTIKFTNALSNEDVHNETEHAYEGAVFAILTGYEDPQAMMFVEENLVPILKEELQNRRLTVRGVYNSLKITFAKLDIQCFTNRQEGAATLLVTLFLGKRLWIAKTGGQSRAFFVSEQILSKVRASLTKKPPSTPRPDTSSTPVRERSLSDPASAPAYINLLPLSAKKTLLDVDTVIDDPEEWSKAMKDLEYIPEIEHSKRPASPPLPLSEKSAPPPSPLIIKPPPEPLPFPRALTVSPDLGKPITPASWNETDYIGGSNDNPKSHWASPNISYILVNRQGYLVLGSVGFHPLYAPARQVVKYLAKKEGATAQDLSRELVEIVYRAGCLLSITAIVVKVTSRTLQIAAGGK